MRERRRTRRFAEFVGMGLIIAVGAQVGVVLGTILGDLVMGMVVGAGAGAVIGAMFEGLRTEFVDPRDDDE